MQSTCKLLSLSSPPWCSGTIWSNSKPPGNCVYLSQAAHCGDAVHISSLRFWSLRPVSRRALVLCSWLTCTLLVFRGFSLGCSVLSFTAPLLALCSLAMGFRPSRMPQARLRPHTRQQAHQSAHRAWLLFCSAVLSYAFPVNELTFYAPRDKPHLISAQAGYNKIYFVIFEEAGNEKTRRKSHSFRPIRNCRSEERRVGKECYSG